MSPSHRLWSLSLFFTYIVGGIALLLFSSYLVPIFVAVIGVLSILAIRFFISARTSLSERLLFVLSIMLFYTSGLAFFVFLEHRTFEYITLVLVAVIAAIYIENAYKYLWHESNYQVSALSNVSSYMHLLSVFFLTVSLFDLRFFFGISSLVMLIVAGVFGLMLFYVFLWSQKVLLTSSRWYSLLFAFIFVEFIYVLNVWPHLPLVKGVVTLALVYGMMQILLASLRDILNPKKVARILGIVAFVLVIVLATSQWK